MRSKLVAAVAATLALSACASAPPLDFSLQAIQPAKQVVDARLQGVSVELDPAAPPKSVQADDTIYPLWQTALAAAVAEAKVFNDGASRQAKLQVKISKVDAPEFGAAMTTRSVARYDIVDATNGEVLQSRVVDVKGVTPADFAFAGYVRAMDSINRSVRNNIAEFLAGFGASASAAAAAE